ncbi:unnamed protein product [Durusdinium trenchii]|uniref:Uncharacterized protein n=1 Tax=Durusdinium trenchii TaxID=1381693 RepID=A0ABP0NL99_9DINO
MEIEEAKQCLLFFSQPCPEELRGLTEWLKDCIAILWAIQHAPSSALFDRFPPVVESAAAKRLRAVYQKALSRKMPGLGISSDFEVVADTGAVRLLFLNALRFRRGAEIDLSQSVTIGSIIADDGKISEAGAIPSKMTDDAGNPLIVYLEPPAKLALRFQVQHVVRGGEMCLTRPEREEPEQGGEGEDGPPAFRGLNRGRLQALRSLKQNCSPHEDESKMGTSLGNAISTNWWEILPPVVLRRLLLRIARRLDESLVWLLLSPEIAMMDLWSETTLGRAKYSFCAIKPVAFCCKHVGRGCPLPVSMPYNCHAQQIETWAIGKKLWCCQNYQVGCPHYAPTLPYDCEAGPCPMNRPSLASRSAHRHAADIDLSIPLDSNETTYQRASNWKKGWSSSKQVPEAEDYSKPRAVLEGKKFWCCEHRSKGCEAASSPYDCAARSSIVVASHTTGSTSLDTSKEDAWRTKELLSFFEEGWSTAKKVGPGTEWVRWSRENVKCRPGVASTSSVAVAVEARATQVRTGSGFEQVAENTGHPLPWRAGHDYTTVHTFHPLKHAAPHTASTGRLFISLRLERREGLVDQSEGRVVRDTPVDRTRQMIAEVVPVPVPVPPAPRVVERVVPERLPAPLRAVSPMVARVAPVAPSSPTDAQALKPPKKKKKLKTGEIEDRRSDDVDPFASSSRRLSRATRDTAGGGKPRRRVVGDGLSERNTGLAADGTTRGEGSAMKLWKSECFANSPAYVGQAVGHPVSSNGDPNTKAHAFPGTWLFSRPFPGSCAMRKCLGAVLGLALLFAPRLFVPSWTPRGAAQTNRAPKRRAVPAGRASGRSKAVQSVLQEVTRMGPEDLERLVEELLPTLNTKRRLLRDRLRPRRIILVRHGESVGNRDKTAYQHTPDSKIELTPLGELQGAAAGQQIRTLVGNGTVRFFYSPYMRTRQTLQEILKAFKGQQIEMCAEPRLREQDFGNFQDAQQMELVYRERQKFGRFYYRFPNGEAGTDVFDRVSDFWSSLLRSMDTSPVENLVLVTHGLLMRIFCMVYFHWTVEEFEEETWLGLGAPWNIRRLRDKLSMRGL